ncbi:MAG: FAD-dependent monooxygenase [Cyanobium sp.]
MAPTLARSLPLHRSRRRPSAIGSESVALTAQVRGAGPTGALAALAMAEAGWNVTLIDPLEARALCSRQRAYALTHSSRRLLQRLDLWAALEPHLCPFERLHLCDRGVGRALDFGPGDLPQPSAPAGGDAVGWIVRHSALMETLLQRLQAHPAIRLALAQAPGSTPDPGPQAGAAPADLVLACDGPASSTRSGAGLAQWRLPYRQACLTVQVQLRGSEGHQAWEVLRPEGPFAVLPLGPGKAQVVWSAPAARCRQLQELSDSAFLEQLAAVLPSPLELDGLLDTPRSFPVALELAPRLHRGPLLLVGESAHRCHPVGGQGLNLCWRDVAELHRLAVAVRQGRLPLHRLGSQYARRRRLDLLLTLAATDLIVRLFSNRSPLLLPLRHGALALLARLSILRRLSLQVMSEGMVPLGPVGR